MTEGDPELLRIAQSVRERSGTSSNERQRQLNRQYLDTAAQRLSDLGISANVLEIFISWNQLGSITKEELGCLNLDRTGYVQVATGVAIPYEDVYKKYKKNGAEYVDGIGPDGLPMIERHYPESGNFLFTDQQYNDPEFRYEIIDQIRNASGELMEKRRKKNMLPSQILEAANRHRKEIPFRARFLGRVKMEPGQITMHGRKRGMNSYSTYE